MGYDVLIGGDFNESIEKGKIMQEQMSVIGLKNVIGETMTNIPATRVPGQYAIDHIWGLEGIMERIVRRGIVPRDEIFISDHHGIFVDITTGEIPEVELEQDRQPRYLKSGNRKNRRKYLEYAIRRFEEEKVWKKVKSLGMELRAGNVSNGFEQSLNNLDEKVQKILLSGENKLRPSKQEARSEELSR